MPKRKVATLSRRFADVLTQEEKVETDLKFWAVHALHWHALLLAVAGGLYLGYGFGMPSNAGAAAAKTASKPATAPSKPVAKPSAPLPMANAVAFTKDLKTGMKDPQVVLLQQFLNGHGYLVAKDGPGSPGKETDKFGAGTRTVLATFQKDKGITSKESGMVGPKTRAYLIANGHTTVAVEKPTAPPPPIVMPTKPVIVTLNAPAAIQPGKKFNVYVSLKDAQSLDTARLNGSFDPSLLRLDGVAVMGFDSAAPGNFINNASGTFSFGEFSLGHRVNGDLRIANLTFVPKKKGKARLDLGEGTGFYVSGESADAKVSGVDIVIGGKK